MPQSSRQKGNRIENRCAQLLEKLGYCAYISRGSRGSDIFAIHQDNDANYAHLLLEVGTRNKPIGPSLSQLLRSRKPAGTICIVARWIKRNGSKPYFLWSTTAGKFKDITNLLRYHRENRNGGTP